MWWLFLLLAASALALPSEVPGPETRSEPQQRWTNVRVNHFMAQENDTFPLRFFYNPVTTTGETISIVLGGEWGIAPGYAAEGIPVDIARTFGGAAFYVEHRYYGLSRPTEGTSLPELRYLSADQTLGDFAQFIEHLKSDDFENGLYRNASVVLIGCSTAGTLATWMRLAYPHLVDIAISDSGPLLAHENFFEFFEAVTDVIRERGGEQCVSSIQDAISQTVDALATTAGLAQVSSLYNTCTPLPASSPLEHATFFRTGITEVFATFVQYAQPGVVEAACEALTDENTPSAMQRLAGWLAARRSGCLETRYQELVASHRNTSYDAPVATTRVRTYQSCVEFGWYRTTNGSAQPFSTTVPLEYYHQLCRDYFSEDFTVERIRAGIQRTNRMFGGLAYRPDGVISLQGTPDPWSRIGATESQSRPNAPVYILPNMPHCGAMNSVMGTLTEEAEEFRANLLSDVRFLLTGVPPPSGAPRTISSLALMVGVVTTLMAM